ncbi:MAG: hypothetical protein IIV97_02250, partial [Oscillospiraceae bacterium]|nr:hypothetical protein [Oscillospiraceae bacterium]
MKSNTFSRILSTILALSLVIAMLPSAFAAEAGYKVVYDFTDNYAEGVPYTSGENGFFNYKGVNEVDSYDKSNGFWKFEAMNGSLSVNHAYTTANGY